MAQLDLAAASNVLKVKYLGPIREQLNNATILMSRVMKDSSTINVGGKSFTVPLHSGRNRTAGTGTSDGGALPTAGVQGYDAAIVPNKYLYSRIQISGPTIAATKNNADSFVQAVSSEIDGAVRDMKRSMNRQLHSDGSDALAFWTTADDTSGTTVDDNRGNAFVHLQSGATTLDLIATADNSTKRGTAIVVTLGAAAATNYAITWTGTVSSSADGDYLVLPNSLGYQMMGLQGIIGTGDPVIPAGGGAKTGLHSMAVATYPYWKAQAFTNSGTNRDLTLDLMQKPLDAICTASDYTDADVDFLMCSYGVRAKYISLLVSEKRFVNTMELDGGFKGVDFNGIPLVPDPQCQKNRIYYIVPDSLRIFRTSDFDWMDKDGAVLSRVSGFDMYEAVLFHYGDLATVSRNANGLLDDITE
jgi:hypothetical protein